MSETEKNKKFNIIHMDAIIEKVDGSPFEDESFYRILDALIDAVEKENAMIGCGSHEYGSNTMCQCCETTNSCHKCLKEIVCPHCKFPEEADEL